MLRQPLAIALFLALPGVATAQSDKPPQEWRCISANHTLAVSVMPSDARPALFTLDEKVQSDAKLTRRNGNIRLFAAATADKLFLALHLRADGSSEILHQPMGGESVLEPATCEGRAGLIAYLESRL